MTTHHPISRPKPEPASKAGWLIAVVALLFVAVVVAAAYVGREHSPTAQNQAAPAHHIASLAEVQEVLKKAQSQEQNGQGR